MLKSKKENKLKWTVLIVCCLSSIFEQWTRTMFPFSLWGLKPRPEFSVALMINAINGIATLIGTFFVANIIDTLGTRTTAIISVIVVSIFQLGYSWITNYYFFGLFQLLMLFNHMPTVVDATIAQLANEIADVKQKARLMSQTAIPTSIAFAIGPLIAVQLFYTFSPSIHWIQSICGIFHIITVLPIIFFLFPKSQEFSSEKGTNIFNMFSDILKKPGNKETLLFILLISGTWNSYDQAIRLHLTGQMLTSPFKMAILALLLGSASLISNFVLLPILQRKITTKRIVQLSLVIMTICYFYLTRVTDYEEIIIGMPFQVVGVCLALGPLTAQILGSVPASHAGKSAALNRIAQISATALAPLITGAYTDQDEAYILCWVNIGICVITFVLIELYGNFMGKCTTNLPWCMSQASMDRFE